MRLIAFIIVGGAALFGVAQPAVGFHNLTGLPGGFMPHGVKGVWMGVIIGIFSFIGIELIVGRRGDPLGQEHAAAQRDRNGETHGAQRHRVSYLIAKQICRPQCDAGIQQPGFHLSHEHLRQYHIHEARQSRDSICASAAILAVCTALLFNKDVYLVI